MIEESLKRFLIEDIGYFDLTGNIGKDKTATASLICRSGGILCGIHYFEKIFSILDDKVVISSRYDDGDIIQKGEIVATVTAGASALLTGERTALNLLSRLSGIASLTNEFVSRISDLATKLLDTRKTTPGLRIFEKYAARVGGAINHRLGLYDCAMIKDNHIKVAGSIKAAISTIKAQIPFSSKIEVETKNIDEVREAMENGADIILLDHFEQDTMRTAVRIKHANVVLEASGNIDIHTVRSIALTGVDYISTGFITHHAVWSDFALKITD